MKVKLENKAGIFENRPGLNINEGECVFPFKHKDQEYNECFNGKRGEWCATEVNKKTKKVKKWAYCDKPKEQIKLTIKKKKLSIIPSHLLLPKTSRVMPTNYVLPNNKGFVNWFDSTFSSYKVKPNTKLVKSAKFSFFNHQKIIRDYINNESPYRGLLLYHGLGVGKTCGSIAIAEGFRSHRDIVVLLNTSLEQNYKVNLMRCGYDYFRINEHWFFHKFTKNDHMKKYAKKLGISLKRVLNGAWFIDFSKEPNYNDLTKTQQSQVDEQINSMINDKYTFLHMDGLTEKNLKELNRVKALDGKVLIIDEVHNLTNAMSKGKPGVRAKYLEQLIMDAIDLKVVFLSGTPMINNLYETAKLFNLLRGKIGAFEVTFTNRKTSDINWSRLEHELSTNPLIDQVIIKKRDNFLTITRLPRCYIKINNKIVRDEDVWKEAYAKADIPYKDCINHSDDDVKFKNILEKLLPDYANINIQYYTALPNDPEKFNNLFYDSENNKIKNKELFKSRIMGLISFYKTSDTSLVPSINRNELVEVPMSEYQFINYAKVRKAEIQQDKNRKTKKKGKQKKKEESDAEIFEAKSSYRAYSRMHCSFVFPETIERPLPANRTAKIEEITQGLSKFDEMNLQEGDEDYALIDTEDPGEITVDMKKHIKAYEIARSNVLKKLYETGEDYLIMNDPEKLLKYSPKYNEILNKISTLNGLAFVYTEYKTLEGIAILSIILKVNGYAEFKLKKMDNGNYTIDEKPEDKDKPKFAFWAGSEAQSDLLRKIYNNEFSELPTNLKEELIKRKKDNLRGDVIKILLTTKTGAEGIDLKNVRQVHIVEPYWNPVRLQQVKGRAVRVGSHLELPEKDRNVDIYVYLSIILPKDKKTEPIIDRDQNGTSSDQALYNLSDKKLKVMNELLKLVKEVSIDCSININDTKEALDPFTCLNYGSNISPSFIPNIEDEFEDSEQRRRTVQTSWKPIIINIPGKGKYGLKPAPEDDRQLLFDLTVLRDGQGKSGEPVGELLKNKDGKTTVKFFKKTKMVVAGTNKTKTKTKNKDGTVKIFKKNKMVVARRTKK